MTALLWPGLPKLTAQVRKVASGGTREYHGVLPPEVGNAEIAHLCVAARQAGVDLEITGRQLRVTRSTR